VAHSFAAGILNPQRFQRQQELAACLGLVQVIRQSGEKQGKGRLRSVGQKRLRNLLIEAAWIWKRKDEEARVFYNRILGGCGGPQKTIAALARKLAVLLWQRSLAAIAA
jgi:transposase